MRGRARGWSAFEAAPTAVYAQHEWEGLSQLAHKHYVTSSRPVVFDDCE